MAASMEVAVFAETNLGTHIGVSVPPDITARDLKSKLGREHYLIFPNVGEVKVNALMVKRKSCFYHLPDSLTVKNVFRKSKHCWFLKMAATRVEDVCKQVVNSTDNVHGKPATIIDRLFHQEATTAVTNATAGQEEQETPQPMNGTASKCSSGRISAATIIDRICHQEATTAVTNATARQEEQEIPQPMNGTASKCSSDRISVTGILGKYFSVSDEKHVCHNEVESIRKSYEEYESEELLTGELGDTKFNNHVASAGFLVEQSNNKKSISENNTNCLFIDSDAGKSEFNVVNMINEKHLKANLPSSVATELTHLGKVCANLYSCDRGDGDQGCQELELEQSQCNIATKIYKDSSALAGLTSARNQDRDNGDNIVSGEGGAHHCVQDTNIKGFQSNTEAKQKEIAVPTHAMTKSVDFGVKRSTATTDSGQQDFSLEISKCHTVSRTRKKHVKSKSSVSNVAPMAVNTRGNSGLNADITHVCRAPQNHLKSDLVNKSESSLPPNIHENDFKHMVSTSIAGEMSLDCEAREAVGENNIEDIGFHRDCDIKKMRHTSASSMNQQCSRTEISMFDPTLPTNIWKDGRNVASNNKPHGRHAEINEAVSSNSGFGSFCSRKLNTDIGSAAESPFVAGTSKNKLGRSEVGRRVIQAVTELGISARNQTPLISIRRSRKMAFSTGLAKHLVFEIGNDND